MASSPGSFASTASAIASDVSTYSSRPRSWRLQKGRELDPGPRLSLKVCGTANVVQKAKGSALLPDPYCIVSVGSTVVQTQVRADRAFFTSVRGVAAANAAATPFARRFCFLVADAEAGVERAVGGEVRSGEERTRRAERAPEAARRPSNADTFAPDVAVGQRRGAKRRARSRVC